MVEYYTQKTVCKEYKNIHIYPYAYKKKKKKDTVLAQFNHLIPEYNWDCGSWAGV